MPRTRSIVWSELKLGVVGIAAFVMTATLILAVGGQGGFFWQRYPVKARFDDINGLKTGAVVRLSGKDVGKVTSAEFDQGQVEIVMEVSKRVQPLITSESTASVGSLGLLGETIIDIKGAGAGTPIAPWGYVRAGGVGGPMGSLTSSATESLTKASESLERAGQLLQGVQSGRGTVGKLMTDQALYDEMRRFMASAANVTRALDQGQGTLGGLLKDKGALDDLKASLESLKALTAKLNEGQGALGRLLNDEAMAKSLAGTTADLKQITERLSRGEGTAGKLLTDQQLYEHMRSLTARFDTLLANLDAGRGTAGQLLRDQRLYETMNQAATELRSLLADIRKDPKKYLRVSVSIF